MKQLVEIKNNRPKTLRIQYELGNLCNYKCWYCFPGSNEGTHPWPDVDIVKHNLMHLIEFYFENGIDEIQLNFLGGEPTLWKHLGTLIQHVSENGSYNRKKKKLKITAQTNASRTLRWWEEYAHYFDFVGISVHHERADLDHIIEVCKILMKKDIFFLTTILMDHKEWDKCKSMVDYLVASKPKFMVAAKPIHVNGETNYNEEQLEYLKVTMKRNFPLWKFIKHISKFMLIPRYTAIFDDGSKEIVRTDHYFILNNLNKFFGWKCTVGTNFLAITKDGNLSGTCHVKLYGKDDYFNINDLDFIEKFNPTLQPVTCDKMQCLCAGEAVLSKWKVDDKKVIPIHAN